MPRKEVDDPFNDDDFGMPEATSTSDEMPEASSEDRPSFIKPHHVGKALSGQMELLRVMSETTDFSDVVLLVKFREKNFRLGLRTFSADYMALTKRFGKKKLDWHGPLRYKVMPHKGNPQGYVAIR